MNIHKSHKLSEHSHAEKKVLRVLNKFIEKKLRILKIIMWTVIMLLGIFRSWYKSVLISGSA